MFGNRFSFLLAALAVAVGLPAAAAAESTRQVARFDAAVERVLAEPYQPAYVPLGFDSAFAPALVHRARRVVLRRRRVGRRCSTRTATT